MLTALNQRWVHPDFGRAVKAISGIDLKPVQIDVIYHVLDKYVHYTLGTSWLSLT